MAYEDIFNERTVEEAKKRLQSLSDEHLKYLEKQFADNTKFLEKNSRRYQEEYIDFQREKLKLASDTEKKIESIQKHYLKNTSGFRKRQILKDEQEALKAKKESAVKERDFILKIQKELGKELTLEQQERIDKLKKEIDSYTNQIKNTSKRISATDKKIEQSDNEYQKKKLARLKKFEEASARLSKAQIEREKNSAKTKEKLQKDLDNASSKKDRVSAYMMYGLSNLRNSIDSMSGETGWETAKNIGFEAKENLAKIGSSAATQLLSKVGDALQAGMDKVNQAIQDVTSHRTKIMTRLQGLGSKEDDYEYNYSGLLDTVAKNLAVSPYITQKAFMQKLDEAVDKGIAYNVEQRAFLSTIKDEIATTFDAFDSNLLRLIKLQQADSTAARLGMEASLTKTLNSVFKDSSYLTDKIYENVRGALVEAESTMGRNQSTEFEYTVQKWLGALYSLGASSELINQIAQGLNYLGTGNVQALAGNSSLQTLFAMSASRAKNVDYADLLVGGLTTEKTNELLKSMVEYLKEIAEDNKKNNVVKSAYGSIYNMSLADMTAITSLTSTDISSLYSQSMSYGGMTDELARQFGSISKRLSTSEMVKNVVDNFIYSLGSEISQNAVTYVMWQITDLIQQSTGGINLPAISVMGNMVDLSAFTVEGIIKSGIVGLATLGQLGNILSSVSNKGGLNLSAWNASDTIQRGQIESLTAGSINTTSGSTLIGSSSSSDMKKSSIAGATEDAAEVAEITNPNSEEEYSTTDIYNKIYKERDPIPVEISTTTRIGAALETLSSYMLNANRVTDVNIKQSSISVPVTMTTFDSKFKEEIKNYIKTVYVELLASELKESLIGQTRGISGATIAKVCDKIMNDKVDVQVKNDGFDMFLANSYALHG